MHILWMSDNPDTPSGFGMVTRFVCEGLARRGHRVSILGWQAREPYTCGGCKVYPIGADPMGGDAILPFLVRHRPDVVITLADVWWLPFFASPHIRRQMEFTDTRWLLYFPIDGDTKDERLPPSWIELLREVDVPIAMSRYGQRIANRCGIACEYIPHGVDLEVFSPPADREEAKARVDASGRFVILSDSRNQPRKLLPRVLDIFARFAKGRPDALLHLHTDPDDPFTKSGQYSYDIRADIRHFGIEGQVRFSRGFTLAPGSGLSLEELALLYKAADVHLLASSGEGFGLPTLQAAAAGAVPMASAYSASQELVEGHGEAIGVREWSETEFGIRRAMIDIDDAAGILARYYDDRQLLRERSAQSRRFALGYGWNDVLGQWDRLLRAIGDSRRFDAGARYRRTSPAPKVIEQKIHSVPGASITVRMVQREQGLLEASIGADARLRDSEVRIPTLPPPCEVARVRVLRRPGYVAIAPPGAGVFRSLKEIFPMLIGWSPHPADDLPPAADGLQFPRFDHPDGARLELAQSILLIDLDGHLPDLLRIDAARLGVPCIGPPSNETQVGLWPELCAIDAAGAVNLSRELLTNGARMRRLTSEAKAACARLQGPGEEQLAAALRGLHDARKPVAMSTVA